MRFPVSIRSFTAFTALVSFLPAAPARAHGGGVPAHATFVHPAAPVEIPRDGGAGGEVRWSWTPEAADARYRIEWTDDEIDPTGRFTLYYLARALPDAATVADVERLGTPVRTAGGRIASVWVSCRCDEDAGVTCPTPGPGDDADAGTRWCDDHVDWDTAAVPPGAYFIAAVNHDPPFHVWDVSAAPVLVAHGGTPPPAVIVVRPGSFALADDAYRVAVLVAGQAPLVLDLAWTPSDPAAVGAPGTAIAAGLAATPGDDGAVGYAWDVRGLAPGRYVVGATLRDAGGRAAAADCRGGLTILHGRGGNDLAAIEIDAAIPMDLGAPPAPAPGGCGCAIGGRRRDGPLAPVAVAGAAGAVVAIALGLARRRRRRLGEVHQHIAAASAIPCAGPTRLQLHPHAGLRGQFEVQNQCADVGTLVRPRKLRGPGA